MAKPSLILIKALRETARKLEEGSNYQWGHMGSCNCGHLAQTITKYSKSEIHSYAMERYGDWNKQVMDYCPSSGLSIDRIISIMLQAGLTRDDLKNLEKLSDRSILEQLDNDRRHLRYNHKPDVIQYLKAWADLLEKQLVEKIELTDLFKNKAQPDDEVLTYS